MVAVALFRRMRIRTLTYVSPRCRAFSWGVPPLYSYCRIVLRYLSARPSLASSAAQMVGFVPLGVCYYSIDSSCIFSTSFVFHCVQWHSHLGRRRTQEDTDRGVMLAWRRLGVEGSRYAVSVSSVAR